MPSPSWEDYSRACGQATARLSRNLNLCCSFHESPRSKWIQSTPPDTKPLMQISHLANACYMPRSLYLPGFYFRNNTPWSARIMNISGFWTVTKMCIVVFWCVTVQSCRWLSPSRVNLSPPSSRQWLQLTRLHDVRNQKTNIYKLQSPSVGTFNFIFYTLYDTLT